jgi:hypothetical protein
LDAVVSANDIQSVTPPDPFASVAVTVVPGAADVVLTVSAGGPVALKVAVEEVPPPGDGLNTVTGVAAIWAISAAAIAAVNRVAFTNVVGRGEPFQRTTDDETKPEPLTVSVNAGPPATTPTGDSEEIAGTGFTDASTVTGGLVAASVKTLFRNRRNSY